MGLLKKIEDSVKEKPYFSTFCKKYGFNHAGIYILRNNNFILTKSCGLDAETIFKSVSTKDFWEGTLNLKIDNDFWISFSRREDNLEPFFQFFSKKTVDSLNSIYYYIFKTTNETGIFFIINDEEEYILPELDDGFTKELLYFADDNSFLILKPAEEEDYSDDKFMPAEINFSELYDFYLEQVKYYNEGIQKTLLNCFYEQLYLHVKKLLPENTRIFSNSKCSINILLPKTGILNKITFNNSLNSELKMYCSKNTDIAVRLYF